VAETRALDFLGVDDEVGRYGSPQQLPDRVGHDGRNRLVKRGIYGVNTI